MSEEFDFWRIAAGLGLFLLGMFQLEQSLRQLAGRQFKIFLRRHTSHPIKGVLSGALATAALQSSSVVGLIVLALAGAGVVSLASGLGIVFGANLGTTATGWIVATFGFKLDLQVLALPMTAIGGLGVVWSAAGSRRSGFSYLIAGFGLMLLGLDFMKAGTSNLTSLFQPEVLAGYPLIVFLAVGLLLTAAIQSSSATIMVTLSALYAGVIDLPAAAAVAIGADLGTTGTILLGATTGDAIKKQIASGLLLFNIVADVLAYVLIHPLLYIVTDVFAIKDELIALVAFHSLINVVGILIFLPLIRPLANLLHRRVKASRQRVLHFIQPKEALLPDIAIDSTASETMRLIDQVCLVNQLAVSPDSDSKDANNHNDSEFTRAYDDVKRLEGEILSYTLRLQGVPLSEEDSERLGRLMLAIRNAVHSAKYVKDIRSDLALFRESPDDSVNAYFGRVQQDVVDFYGQVKKLRSVDSDTFRSELITDLHAENEQQHNDIQALIYRDLKSDVLPEDTVSTLLNVNRELLLSNRSMLDSISDTVGTDTSESRSHTSVAGT